MALITQFISAFKKLHIHMIVRMRAAVWFPCNRDSLVILMQQKLQIPFRFCKLCWWLLKLLSDKISQNYTYTETACKNWNGDKDFMWLSTVVPSTPSAWQYTVAVEDSNRGSLLEGTWEFYVRLQLLVSLFFHFTFFCLFLKLYMAQYTSINYNFLCFPKINTASKPKIQLLMLYYF